MTDESHPVERSEKCERVIFAIVSEILRVMSLTNQVWARKLVGNILKKPIRQMAEIIVSFDEDIAVQGWSATMKEYLVDFVKDYRVRGFENVSRLASFDRMQPPALRRHLPVMGRDDVKFIASDISIVHDPKDGNILYVQDTHQHAYRETLSASARWWCGYLPTRRLTDRDVTPGGCPILSAGLPAWVCYCESAQSQVRGLHERRPAWFKSPWIRI
jgi:hypothetical protein